MLCTRLCVCGMENLQMSQNLSVIRIVWSCIQSDVTELNSTDQWASLVQLSYVAVYTRLKNWLEVSETSAIVDREKSRQGSCFISSFVCLCWHCTSIITVSLWCYTASCVNYRPRLYFTYVLLWRMRSRRENRRRKAEKLQTSASCCW